ncbi:MAG: GNAT family N-acetyltransferase [Chitinophagaceae bacterium]|nr:GNAT family N-acetyltransferase [Chitinophagaceae bacterium]
MQTVQYFSIDTQHAMYAQVYDLRHQVLRVPLGLSLHNEDTSADKEDDIWVAVIDTKVVACLMLKNMGGNRLKLRQMAVAADMQGKGLGKQLITNAENDARKKGVLEIHLHARQYAEAFYQKLGYTSYGAPFAEVGIPHTAMQKQL